MDLETRCLGSVVTGAVTFGAAPLVIRIMRYADVIDEPNDRSSHTVPTPRGGGIACVAGASASVFLFRLRGVEVERRITVPSIAIALIGLADDRMPLPASVRLLVQAAIGAGAGACSGLGAVKGPLVGAVVFPAVVNAMNFMDGINGITGLTTWAWGLVSLTNGGVLDPHVSHPLGAILFGASLGFLPWNLPEARVFLGDVGSYFMGGSIAAAALAVARNSSVAPFWAIGAALAPLVPYFADTGVTILSRVSQGRRLTEAHRDHFYQRLVDRPGWNHSKVAAIYGGCALFCGALANFGLRRAGESRALISNRCSK